MKPTLLVLAAGIGSRYGGLKQLDGVGPDGETIIDYSVFDAKRAGFGKVVFVIRRSIEDDFRAYVEERYKGQIPVEYAFQELDMLPGGHTPPADRQKPWGTGHAVLVARDLIHEPFSAINGDDFYGADAFRVLGNYLAQAQDGAKADYSMVGYQLRNTLSDFGSVSRGICYTDNDGNLAEVEEVLGIERDGSGARYPGEGDTLHQLTGDETASMGIWGFTPSLFDHIETQFLDFLARRGHELRSEFYLPTVVNNLIRSGEAAVKVLGSTSSWFGVTYREDKPFVQSRIRALTESGVYPQPLWS